MNAYDACEQAYRNGYTKGHEDGMNAQEINMTERFEKVFGELCRCGGHYFLHHEYCPHCGRKLWDT
jgi:uncharacterized OB-fold protein